MVDYFTKVGETGLMKSHDAGAVASIFLNRWICQHGVSESFHSDEDPKFESRLYTKLCRTLIITKARTTPSSFAEEWTGGKNEPHSDRITESICLRRISHAYRATFHATSGFSPFKKLTSRELRVLFSTFPPSKKVTTDNALECVLFIK